MGKVCRPRRAQRQQLLHYDSFAGRRAIAKSRGANSMWRGPAAQFFHETISK